MDLDTSWESQKAQQKRIALNWNPQGARREGHPKKTWKRTVEYEALMVGKTGI